MSFEQVEVKTALPNSHQCLVLLLFLLRLTRFQNEPYMPYIISSLHFIAFFFSYYYFPFHT